MNSDVALYWVQQSIQVTAMVAAPILIVALVVGVVVSIIQAITSIQEMTLSFIPKVGAVALVLILLTPWMLSMLSDFMRHVVAFIPTVSH